MNSNQSNEAWAANNLAKKLDRVATRLEQTATAIRLTRRKVDGITDRNHRYGTYASIAAEVQRDVAALITNLQLDALTRDASEADTYRAKGECDDSG